jgi:hypothetical protein
LVPLTPCDCSVVFAIGAGSAVSNELLKSAAAAGAAPIKAAAAAASGNHRRIRSVCILSPLPWTQI